MTAPYASSLLVTVNGIRISDALALQLTSASVETNERMPDTFTLRFRDPDRVVLKALNVGIGTSVEVSVETSEAVAPVSLLIGEITAMEAELDAEGSITVLRGSDLSHLLMRRCTTTAYAAMTYSAIAKQIAARNGLGAGRIAPTTTVLAHTPQGNVDDWTFLQQLADEVGYVVRVRDRLLDFAPLQTAGGAPHTLRAGADLLSLRTAVRAAEQVSEVEVRSWNLAKKVSVVAKVPVQASGVDVSFKPAALGATFNGGTLVHTGSVYEDDRAAKMSAVAVADRLAANFAELEAVVRGDPTLRAGCMTTVEGLGEPFDGRYRLTRVRHTLDPDEGYCTQLSVRSRQDPAPSRPRVGPTGVAVGVVTDVADPASRGRATVKLPWLSPTYVTGWAPVVHAGAGKKRGSFLPPEVDDQVLVAFENGDLGRPYILGGLHSNECPPPTTGKVQDLGRMCERAVVSRSGHALRFWEQDGLGRHGIALTTGDDKLQLAMDTTTTTVSLTSDGTVVVDAPKGVLIRSTTGEVAIAGDAISLKATNGVTVDGGSGNVAVNTAANLRLAGSRATLAGSESTQIDGGARCAIAAALVTIN